ncbi:VapC toxin protein [hydrothermal vent metagenome]|uniref:VapC toxin protein n=1 Tax=hydrothermal vent metagenome TaxID=652676 RepID=A0A3B0WXE3_9ZZZZ
MNDVVMLDTNICSYIMRGASQSLKSHLMNARQDSLCISSIVLAEIEYGVAKSPKHQQAVNAFLKMVNIAEFDYSAAKHYGEIRHLLTAQGNIIGSNDLLIAAHSRSYGAVLVTNSMKKFARVPGLQLENWVEPKFIS